MSLLGRAGGPGQSSGGLTPARSQPQLQKTTEAFLKDAMGIKGGIQVVALTPGKNVEGLRILQQLDATLSSQLLESLANLAMPSSNLQSAVVVIGGREILEKTFKTMASAFSKKLSQTQLEMILKTIGFSGPDFEGIFVSPEAGILPGGLLLIQSGIEELGA